MPLSGLPRCRAQGACIFSVAYLSGPGLAIVASGEIMHGAFALSRLRFQQYSWAAVAVGLLIIQAVLSIILKQGRSLDAYCEISYFVLLMLACGIAALNAVQNRQTIRLFWSFLAVSFGLWALVPCAWFFNFVLRGRAPAFLFETFPSFLHIVMMIAAVVSRPHLRLASRRPYRTILNFLILLFIWVFAYAYVLFPYEYGSLAGAMILRYESFYFTENLLLLAVLGLLTFRSQGPWRSIYWQLLGASATYALGSLAANLEWASGNLYGGLIGLPFTASISWFVWIGMLGRRRAPQLTHTVQIDSASTRYSSALAMFAVVAVPFVGLWEVFRTGELYRAHEIRLLLVLITVAILAVAAFIHDYLSNREFTLDVGVAHDRLRLAMESGKTVGWEWDVSTGESFLYGDLQTIFGTSSDSDLRGMEDLLSRVHVNDRSRVERVIADAEQTRHLDAVEFRVVRPDGSVRWVAARGQSYFTASGDPESVFGMVADVTDHKQAQEAIRESEERFRLVANTAPVLIWMAGIDKAWTYANDPWLEFTGQSLKSQLGDGWTEGVHRGDVQSCVRTYREAFDHRERFRMEYRLRHHDGGYRWLAAIGVPRFNPDRSFAGYIGSCIDITERKLAEETLSGVSRRLIEAQEQERTRIARELHDDINQRIALLTMALEEVKRHFLESDPEGLSRIQEIVNRTQEINKDVHAISHRLHSSQLELLGIEAAATGFCRELSEQKNVIVDFACGGLPYKVPHDVSLCLFRVLQEALHNAVKYSEVTRFTVRLNGTLEEIHLTVRDSGVGFDTKAAIHGRGLGLISMRERVSLVKGTISIASKLMGGTEVSIRVPVNVKNETDQVAVALNDEESVRLAAGRADGGG
jgi:PAS domain S-box-containing protein